MSKKISSTLLKGGIFFLIFWAISVSGQETGLPVAVSLEDLVVTNEPAPKVKAPAVQIIEDPMPAEKDPLPDDSKFPVTESSSQRTARINHNLMAGATSVLTFFVIFRLVLVWKINQNRKRKISDLMQKDI